MQAKSSFIFVSVVWLVVVTYLLLTASSQASYGQNSILTDAASTQEQTTSPNVTEATAAIGTAFTYQGRLIDSANPANGQYDFQFRLFTAETAGTTIGTTVVKENVAVVDGVFSLALDFGSNVFTGDSRYLEISVRPGISTGAHTLLSPRRNITPSPYATYADQAGRLNAPNGSTAVSVNSSGNVGIGTTNPLQKLHVAGSFLRVDGRDNEQAYIGGEFGDNIQVGSFNPNIQWVETYNMSTQGRMNLITNQINASSISVSGAVKSEQNKPTFFVSVLFDDCGWQRPYLGCPVGYEQAGKWHTGPGECNGDLEGHGYENGDLDSGWMVMCVAQ